MSFDLESALRTPFSNSFTTETAQQVSLPPETLELIFSESTQDLEAMLTKEGEPMSEELTAKLRAALEEAYKRPGFTFSRPMILLFLYEVLGQMDGELASELKDRLVQFFGRSKKDDRTSKTIIPINFSS